MDDQNVNQQAGGGNAPVQTQADILAAIRGTGLNQAPCLKLKTPTVAQIEAALGVIPTGIEGSQRQKHFETAILQKTKKVGASGT